MGTLGDVKARVASMLGDPDRDWTTDAYITPLINQTYEGIYTELSLTCSPFEEKQVTVPNIGIGEVDLTKYQYVKDKPLYGLNEPVKLWWKQAGQPETYYAPMPKQDFLPDINPSAGITIVSGGSAYTWRSNLLYITPFALPIDLRVQGKFNPPPLVQDDDVIQVHPNMTHCLAFGSVVLIATERGNADWVSTYNPMFRETFNNIFFLLSRQTQKTTQRAGRANPRGRR
jgi:hypothetical protein